MGLTDGPKIGQGVRGKTRGPSQWHRRNSRCLVTRNGQVCGLLGTQPTYQMGPCGQAGLPSKPLAKPQARPAARASA